MLYMDVTEPTQTKWASTIVLVSGMDGTLHICAHYRKLNAVMTQHSYRYNPWTNSITLEILRYFRHWTLAADTGKREWTKEIRIKPTLHYIMVFPVLPTCESDCKMFQGRFNEHWKSRRRESSGKLLCRFGPYRHIFVYAKRTNRSCPMSVEAITQHRCDIEWNLKKSKLFQTVLTTLFRSFALGSSEYQHKQFTQCMDSNTLQK